MPWTKEKNNKIPTAALTSVAQLVRCRPTKQNVTGWTPGQGTCLGCSQGCVRGDRLVFLLHIDVSLLFFLPPSPSL